MSIVFLDVADGLEIHGLQIERFGGSPGLRDAGLLQSAVAQPQATFGDDYLHRDLSEMAAYLFHLVGNHPFVDGNKRVGLASALVCLDLNGIVVCMHTEELYKLTMRVARGALEKREVVEGLREIVGVE